VSGQGQRKDQQNRDNHGPEQTSHPAVPINFGRLAFHV
jgi:hypothetical protein